jgi:hypothetical protein
MRKGLFCAAVIVMLLATLAPVLPVKAVTSHTITLVSGTGTLAAGYTNTEPGTPLDPTLYSGGGVWSSAVPVSSPPIGPWVDPSTVGSGAVWVSSAASTEDGYGDQWRLFKAGFNIPSGATITSAQVTAATGDNAFSICFNDVEIGTSGYVYGAAPDPQLPWVFANLYGPYGFTPSVGDNELYFVLRNWVHTAYNPTGLLYKATITYDLPEYFDVTVRASDGSNPLIVPIQWSYDSSSGTSDTEFTKNLLEGTSLTLTAPPTVTKDYVFYVFDHWTVAADYPDGQNGITFTVTADATATAYYTKVASINKELVCSSSSVLLETVTVDSKNINGATSALILQNGKYYKFKVGGTWINDGNNVADAEYTTKDNWVTHYDGYDWPPYFLGPDFADLQINNQFIDWGPYSGSHEYTYCMPGTGSTVNFRIFDGANGIPNPGWYGDNSGSLTVLIYECYDPTKIPLKTVVYFDMKMTFHAYADVSGVVITDGIGADLVLDSPVAGGSVAITYPGKGKMGATKITWTIGTPTVCDDYVLKIKVHTGLNTKLKQEYTSTGTHCLNDGPTACFTYNGKLYSIKGPSVTVNVV